MTGTDRQAYIEGLKARLEGLREQMNRLQVHGRNGEAVARADIQKALDELSEEKDQVERQIESLADTATDSWRDASASAEEAAGRLERRFERTMAQWFR